uniref:hypothetical protein n=1 Tax=Phocaeicola vulgatus TaxID=821 RepID=UPI001E4F4874
MQLLNKPVPRYYNGEKAEQLNSVSAKTIINIRISFHPQEALKRRNHTIFRHANFIGCLSADKIKMPVRK